MISKIFSGHSFGPACKYVCNKSGAIILETEGIRAHNPKVMTQDFKIQQQLHPQKKQACFHGILSFPPGEEKILGDKKMLEMAQKYLHEISIKNTQYAIVKHTDKAHVHLHIIANMIDNNGDVIKDNYIGLRGKKAAQKLTSSYHLKPAYKKNPHLSHPEALHRYEANRVIVYKAILSQLPFCSTVDELKKGLANLGIATIYKYKDKTKVRQGISFRLGKDCFKGSKVDRRFSLGSLEKYFSFHQHQNPKFTHNPIFPQSHPLAASSPIQDSTNTAKIANSITDLVTEFFNLGFEPAYGGGENMDPRCKRKKKKKRRGLSL